MSVEAFCAERRLEDIHNEDTHVVVVAHQGPLRVLHCLGRGVAFDRLFETDFAFGVAGLKLWPQILSAVEFLTSKPLKHKSPPITARQGLWPSSVYILGTGTRWVPKQDLVNIVTYPSLKLPT